MLFNSINFIFVFFVAFLISYYLADEKFKNVVLILYSIVFFVCGNIKNPLNIILLIVLTYINYILLSLIFAEKSKKMLYISIVFNILVLIIFKLKIFTNEIPLGMSYYIFSFISVTLDFYNDKIKVSNNEIKKIKFSSFFSYSIFFPKVLSGPITRYQNFINDLNSKKISNENIYNGFCLFCFGLGSKTILSEFAGYIINQINVYGYESISMITAWIGVYANALNLYFDFAGYSLMAIGIAKIIGFNLPDNFNSPFLSKSISDFWRRWHITLGLFFKDYVYIPLGGNFKNKNNFRMCINIVIVWILTSLWHGFSLNYLMWGMITCIFIIFEKLFLNKLYGKVSIIGHILVLVVVPVTLLIFSITNLDDLLIYLYKLVDTSTFSYTADLSNIINRYLKMFIICTLFITGLPLYIYKKIYKNKVIVLVLSIVIFILSIYMINVSSNDSFRYFAF